MSLPDFFVVGVPKGGTTALHALLAQHPGLYLAPVKEPKFYLCDGRPPPRMGQRGPGDAHSAQERIWQRDRYEALFDAAPPGTLRGESTPFYLWDKDAHRRLAETVPRARLIAVVRDPIDRAYSNWTHLRSDGLEPEVDFLAACRREPSRIAAGWAPFWRYLELGRYGEQLTHLYRYFPREQVHVLRYRQLVDEPVATLKGITEFLDVDPVLETIPPSNVSHWAPDTPANSALRRAVHLGAALGAYAPPRVWRQAQRPLMAALHRGGAARPRLAPEVRRQLVGEFAQDVAVLEELLGESFQDWLGETGRGAYAVRRSLAPSGRDASQ